MALLDSAQTLKTLKIWKEFPPLILLVGEEEFLIKEHLKEIASHYLKIYGDFMADFNLEKFHAESSEVEKVIESLLTLPCGAGKKLVSLEHLEKYSPNQKKQIEEYCQNPSPTTIFMLTWITKLNSATFNSSFFSGIVSKGCVIKYWKLFEEKRPRWIEGQFVSSGYRIEPKAAELLSEEGGESLSDLQNEIEKLKIYCMESKEISTDKVKEALSFKRLSSLWSLMDLLEAGDRKKAGKILEACLAQGEEPLKIVYFIAKFLRNRSSKYSKDKISSLFTELKLTDLSFKSGEGLEAARLERMLQAL